MFFYFLLQCSTQGLKFRRNFAEFRRNFSFPLGTGKKYFSIFGKFCFEKSKFKKIRPKFTEIHRNSGTEFRFRQSPGFHRKTKWLTLVVLTICYLPIPQWLLLGKKTIFIAYYLFFYPIVAALKLTIVWLDVQMKKKSCLRASPRASSNHTAFKQLVTNKLDAYCLLM